MWNFGSLLALCLGTQIVTFGSAHLTMTTYPTPNSASHLVIVSTDNSTGSPALKDVPVGVGSAFGHGLALPYTQLSFPAKAEEGLIGTEGKPDWGFVYSKGLTFAFMEFPPGFANELNYRNTQEYFIILSGSAELGLMDGTSKVINAGDMLVKVASPHKWKVLGSEPFRFWAMATKCSPHIVNGKELDQEPFNIPKEF